MNEIKNTKENQSFNTSDVLSIAISLVLVLGLTIAIFKNHLEQKKEALAKNYVEKLAQDLADKPVINSMEGQSRLPASVAVNLDPWGGEYKYSIVRNSYGQPLYIMVLSAGPNHKFDTELPTTLTLSQSQIESMKVLGDDVGTIKSFR